jgi:hypothetical protein
MPCPLDRRQEVAIDCDAPDAASIFRQGTALAVPQVFVASRLLAAEGLGSRLTAAIRRLVGRPFRGDIEQDEQQGL